MAWKLFYSLKNLWLIQDVDFTAQDVGIRKLVAAAARSPASPITPGQIKGAEY